MEKSNLSKAENSTFEPQNEQLSMTSGVILTSVSIYGIIVSSGTLAYILKKLKLNQYIKILLSITVGANLLSSILNAVALLLFAKDGHFTDTSCRLNVYSKIPLTHTINMLNMISILRYQMSWMASKSRVLKPWQASMFIGIAFASNYGSVIGAMYWQEYSRQVTKIHDNDL